MSYRPVDRVAGSVATLQEDSEAEVGGAAGLVVGEEVGRFEVVGYLGEGGSASVYRVRHTRLGSDYALKVLHGVGGRTAVARLMEEGRLQSTLDHRHIVRVHDVLEVQGRPALVMDYVDGRSLAAYLKEGTPSREEAERIFRQVLSAVEAAHQVGVVHRDLKPGNIILSWREGEVEAKVSDFGVARAPDLSERGRTRTGALLGTLEYMSPEQLRGELDVDARSDLFSLGVILFELFVGRRPFAREHLVQLVAAIDRADYGSLEGLGLACRVRRAIEATLVASADRRVGSCEQLRAILDGELWEPPAVQEVGRVAQPGPRRASVWMGLVGAAVLMGAVAWVAVGAERRAEVHGQVEPPQSSRDDLRGLRSARLQALGWQLAETSPGEALALFRAAQSEDEAEVLSGAIWDDLRAGGAQVRAIEMGEQVSAVAYSPDGTLLAVGTLDGEVVLREVESGRELRRFESRVRERLLGLEFSQDGASLYVFPSASDDAAGRSDPVRVFDVASGQQVHSLAHGRRTSALEVSSSGRWGATLGYDDRILIWDMSTGAPIETLRLEGDSRVQCLGFVPGEEVLVAVRLTDAQRASWSIYSVDGEGWVERTVKIPQAYVGLGECELAFSPDGREVITTAGRGVLKLDWRRGKVVKGVEGATFRVLAVDPHGETLVHGGAQGEMVVRRIETLEEVVRVRTREGMLTRARYWDRGEGESGLVISGTDGVVRLYDGGSGRVMGELRGNRSWVLGVAAMRGARGDEVATAGRDGAVRIWRLGDALGRVRPLGGDVHLWRELEGVRYAWSAEGRWLWGGTSQVGLFRWDRREGIFERWPVRGPLQWVEGGQEGGFVAMERPGVVSVFGPGEKVRELTIHEGARVFVSPGDARVLVARSHALVVERSGGEEGVLEVRFEDRLRQVKVDWEGHRAVVVDDRDRITVVDLRGERGRIQGQSAHREGAALALRPGGARAAVGYWSGGAEIWDVASGELVKDLGDRGQSVTEMAWSGSGAYLAGGGVDGQVIVWDERGEEVGEVRAHRRAVLDLMFDAQEQVVVSVGQDRQVCVTPVASMEVSRCVRLEEVPRQLRVVGQGAEARVEVLDHQFDVWRWPLQGLMGEDGEDRLIGSGQWNNLRVCEDGFRVVALSDPFASAEQVWAGDVPECAR